MGKAPSSTQAPHYQRLAKMDAFVPSFFVIEAFDGVAKHLDLEMVDAVPKRDRLKQTPQWPKATSPPRHF